MQPHLILTLYDRVITKKNSKRWIVRGGKRYLVPSISYENFCNSAVVEIMSQFRLSHVPGGVPITKPIKIHTAFQIKGKYQVDADNLHTSILDVLMAANVIADDNQVVSGSYTKVSGASEWRTLIEITIL